MEVHPVLFWIWVAYTAGSVLGIVGLMAMLAYGLSKVYP